MTWSSAKYKLLKREQPITKKKEKEKKGERDLIEMSKLSF